MKHNVVDGGKSWKRSRLLMALSALMIALAMLIVVLVIVNLNKDGAGRGDYVDEVVATQIQEEIQRGFQDALLDGSNSNAGVEYLNKILENGRTDSGIELSNYDVFLTKIFLANAYMDVSEYEKSAEILNALEASEKSEENLILIYDVSVYLYNATGDSVKLEEYLGKTRKLEEIDDEI